ncbi:hypothetical protein DO71_5778 [Burkholderia pseudomallei]|nr:hypothetical protein DO71_5778 [Burkholderia pseudomallei]KGC96221.1 hypothetical protein DO63_5888 [Burkholderia pseudomallei]KOT16100.1 hypothetical protein DM47_3484 [Burkholderia mallei]
MGFRKPFMQTLHYEIKLHAGDSRGNKNARTAS